MAVGATEPAPPHQPQATRRVGVPSGTLATLAAVTALGAIVRAVPVVVGGFPLNDGGLFVEMMKALQGASFQLPATASYNGLDIPLAYPPAGLYLGAAWGSLTGMSLIDVERLVPLLLSVAAIPVAYAVYRPLLGSEARAIVATAGFALMARSYNWMITGGGITRGTGFLLALATVAACIRLYQRPRAGRWLYLTGVGAGLTALSHPQAAVFIAASMVVLLPFGSVPFRSRLRRLVGSALIGGAVISPWVLTVVARHGLSTLTGAAQTGGSLEESLVLLLTFRYSDGLFEVLGLVGAFGLFVCLLNRAWLLPVWTAAIFLVGARAGMTYATVPVAGATAYAMLDAFRLMRLPEPRKLSDWLHGTRALALIGLLLVAGTADSLASRFDARSPLPAVSPDSTAAMEWAASHTSSDATFLVAAGEPWQLDALSEWFPVIAARRSVATVQGTEWLGPGVFREQERRNRWLLNCAATTTDDCAGEWSRVVERVDYVLVADGDRAAALGHPCCLQFADRLVEAGGELAFSHGEVRIVRLASEDTTAP